MDDSDLNYQHQYFMSLTKKKNADTADPNVINDQLIRNFIQQNYGIEELPLWDLVELRLSFQNILTIQNLDVLRSLKKLYLDNNIIAQIAGLSSLKALQWLDLSFNNIKQIKGLQQQVNLTDLSLFHNQITEVSSGLQNCLNLNLLSLGDNLISSFEPTVSYLRTYPKLQVLKLEGNKIFEEMSYKTYVISHISQLKYLDYVLLDQEEIEKAREEHRDDLAQKEIHSQNQEQAQKDLLEQKRKTQLQQAFLGSTYNVLQSLLKDFEDDQKKIRVLPNQQELYADFQQRMKELIADFQKNIINKNELRLQMITKFNNSVKKSERDCQTEAINLISDYDKQQKLALRIFQQDEDQGQIQLNALVPKIDILENILIEKELALVERLSVAIDTFGKTLKNAIGDKVNDICKNYQESANKEVDAYFAQIQKIKDQQIRAFYADNANIENFSQEQREVYQERDQLNNAFSSLTEEYKNMNFLIEEEVRKAYEEQVDQFIEDLKKEQHERNRTQLREIMELAIKKKEFIQNTINEYQSQ